MVANVVIKESFVIAKLRSSNPTVVVTAHRSLKLSVVVTAHRSLKLTVVATVHRSPNPTVVVPNLVTFSTASYAVLRKSHLRAVKDPINNAVS